MKSTQITELLANIKATFVSFFSILMFVALGVGVFLGISWSGPALQNAADSMFAEGRFHDFQIQFVYGLTDDDLDELAKVEGVSHVEGAHQSFQTLKHDDANFTVKVQSLGQDIDTPIVREGELPSKPGEMALHAESARALGLGVGDTVTFEHDANAGSTDALAGDTTLNPEGGQTVNESGMKYLMHDAFKVTAIIDSADYLAKASATYGYSNSPSGEVDALAWVLDDDFDASAFRNGYPIVNVACENTDGLSTFASDYKTTTHDIEERIVERGNALGSARFNDLHTQAETKVTDAEKQLADGKQKIEDGEKQLVDGRAELDTKKAEGEQKLADAYQQLQYFEGLRTSGEAQLVEARAEVELGATALAAIDSAKAQATAEVNEADAFLASEDEKLKAKEIDQKQYDADLDAYGAQLTSRLGQYTDIIGEAPPTIDHTNFRASISKTRALLNNFERLKISYKGETMTVAQARSLLAEARTRLSNAEAEYNQRVAQLNTGWAEYYAGQEELNRLVAEGEQKLADGQKEIDEAKAQVAENEPKVIAAREQLDDLKERRWNVLPRAYNAGTGEIFTFSEITGNLGISMAGLFIIVGLLVSYFAVSRIVHEQVAQIGTKKALGFRKGEITKSFLLYSGIAVLIGAIIGAIVAVLVVESIIGGVLSGMFAFGPYPAYFGWGLFALIVALELGLILGATYLACRSILKQHAVELLRGEKPPTGKTRFYEKWGIWEKLPLFLQTIVNNCINDKRRMLSTIVGVAGSTALIVTAITLNNDVLKSYDRHYEDAYNFNAITYVDAGVEDAIENVESALQAEGATTALASMKSYLLELPNGESGAMRIVVPIDEDAFSQVYHVTPTAGSEVDLSAEGAWVSQAYGEHWGAKVGDTVHIDGGDGTDHEVPILGFCKFWLTYHEMVMGADYYQKEFGNDVTANSVLTNTNGAPVDDLSKKLSKVEGFNSIVDDATKQYGNFATFSKVSSAVVAIYLALAALMAIVVLLNLNVMFIDEKKRELIVLMINGFSVKQAKNYISYDSIVLTAIGIVVGVILGCIAGSITVAAIEPSTATFVKSVDAWAVAIGIVGSALLAIVMGLIALRRIPQFNLTDINKA